MFSFAERNNRFITEKLISVGFALSIIMLCIPNTVFNTYVVMGHAHIAMAILYQMKAGKVNFTKAVLYAVLVSALFWVGFNYYEFFTLFAASFLIFHVYSGEVKFINRKYNLPYFILTLCILTITNSWLITVLWGVQLDMSVIWPPVLMAAFFAIMLFFYEHRRIEIEAFFVFLLGLLATLAALEFFDARPLPVQILGFIVLAHYMTFYVNYGYKMLKNKGKAGFSIFTLESVLANLVFFIGFLLVIRVLGTQSPLYEFGYSPTAFYAWTLSHFITTFKISDYKNVFDLGLIKPESAKAHA